MANENDCTLMHPTLISNLDEYIGAGARSSEELGESCWWIIRSGQGWVETVDEFSSRSEAIEMVNEYRMADPTAEYYISSRACKARRDEV